MTSDAKNALIVAMKLGFFPFEDFFDFFAVLPFDDEASLPDCTGNRKTTKRETRTIFIMSRLSEACKTPTQKSIENAKCCMTRVWFQYYNMVHSTTKMTVVQ